MILQHLFKSCICNISKTLKHWWNHTGQTKSNCSNVRKNFNKLFCLKFCWQWKQLIYNVHNDIIKSAGFILFLQRLYKADSIYAYVKTNKETKHMIFFTFRCHMSSPLRSAFFTSGGLLCEGLLSANEGGALLASAMARWNKPVPKTCANSNIS